MIFVLLIDDDVSRTEWFIKHAPAGLRIIHARSAGMALGMLRRDKYQGILLDYDLSRTSITAEDVSLSGADLIVSITMTQDRGTPILIHSISQQGPSTMVKRLETAGFNVTRCPFPEITDEMLQQWFMDVTERQ